MTAHSSGIAAIDRAYPIHSFVLYEALIRDKMNYTAAVATTASWARDHAETDMEQVMTWHEWQQRSEQR